MFRNKPVRLSYSDGNCIGLIAASPPGVDLPGNVVLVSFSDPLLEDYLHNIVVYRNSLRRDTYAAVATALCINPGENSEEPVGVVLINNDGAGEVLKDINNIDNVNGVVRSDIKAFEKELDVTIIEKKRGAYHIVAFSAIPLLARLLTPQPVKTAKIPWGRWNLAAILILALVGGIYLATHPAASPAAAFTILTLVLAAAAYPWLGKFIKQVLGS